MRRLKKIARFLASIGLAGAGTLTAMGKSPAEWLGALQGAGSQILAFIQSDPATSGLISLPLIASAIHSFLKRSQTRPDIQGPFFDHEPLLDPPLKRPGYSDRMAYLMAEFAHLAYHVIEPNESQVEQIIAIAEKRGLDTPRQLARFVTEFHAEACPQDLFQLEALGKELAIANFEYVSHFNRGSTQGFISVRRGAEPLIVVAFRGSEKEVEDWLTNANALPTPLKAGELTCRVHTGFYQGFKCVRNDIVTGIAVAREKLGNAAGEAPVYFTGHSLGGALALVASRELAPNSYGACYSFGAPRVADYNYFSRVKTPHYRVVNSSDIVPRVPPGAEIVVLDVALRLARFLSNRIPVAREAIDTLQGFVDRLRHYRHFGDQRYLTDVAAGDWLKARVLSNPSLIDRTQWFWRHLAVSLGSPVKSHGMQVYRKKLAAIAEDRLTWL